MPNPRTSLLLRSGLRCMRSANRILPRDVIHQIANPNVNVDELRAPERPAYNEEPIDAKTHQRHRITNSIAAEPTVEFIEPSKYARDKELSPAICFSRLIRTAGI
ncbi:uncharacterized protein [Venturia canescens]|uniref:uncharacterized protein n=1 Tax=Venturia canescens TaxID=32260 RepID=UPI001C9D29E8|nr:uncharacterized protein LOC122415896 [Venturia canescens]